jgi:hypothetical protein
VGATFDLERFLSLDPPMPTDSDVATFLRILRTIESVPPDTTAPGLEKTIGGLFPSNKAERDILVSILGYLGILLTPTTPDSRVVSFDSRHVIFPRIASWTSVTPPAGGRDGAASIVRQSMTGSRRWRFESGVH